MNSVSKWKHVSVVNHSQSHSFLWGEGLCACLCVRWVDDASLFYLPDVLRVHRSFHVPSWKSELELTLQSYFWKSKEPHQPQPQIPRWLLSASTENCCNIRFNDTSVLFVSQSISCTDSLQYRTICGHVATLLVWTKYCVMYHDPCFPGGTILVFRGEWNPALVYRGRRSEHNLKSSSCLIFYQFSSSLFLLKMLDMYLWNMGWLVKLKMWIVMPKKLIIFYICG